MALWTPAEITTALWLDAADAATITESGGAVSQWDDKSGNLRHVSQGTSASQPGYTSAESVNFDGSEDHLFRTDAFMYAAGQAHVFVVVTPETLGANEYLFGEGKSTDDDTIYSLMIMNAITSSTCSGFIRNDAASIRLDQPNGALSGAWVASEKTLIAAQDTGSNFGLRKNGGTATSANYSRSGALTPDRFAIGGLLRSSFGIPVHVKVHEFIVLTSAPTTDERQKIEGYLAWKWGLEASLPSGHPYELAAPEVAGGPVTNTVSGTLAVDSTPANRNVLALNSATPFSVLAAATTPAGLFSFNFGESSATVLLAALDNYGRPFEPEYEYLAGDLILPIPYTGYVYEITTPGTSGAAAPNWSTVVGGTTAVGTAVATTRISYKSLAHGPVTPISSGVPEEPVDEYFDSVSLLLHMDGADGSTTFTDSSSNNFTLTTNGSPVIGTAQSKFGGAAANLTGAAAALKTPTNAAFSFGTGDFTVEMWVYHPVTGNPGYLDNRLNSPATAFALYDSNAGATITPTFFAAAANRITGTINLSTSTWHHLALCRASGVTRLFVDGVQSGSNYTDSNNYLSTDFVVGSNFVYSAPVGWLDDLRITKGVARYTAAFTPPTAPFPDVGPTPTEELWTPAEITTALWLKADDATTITESGGLVSEWRDKSGNGRHISQGTGSLQPEVISSGLNGKNVLRFLNDRMTGAHADFLTTGATVFALFDLRSASSTEPEVVIEFGNNSSNLETRRKYVLSKKASDKRIYTRVNNTANSELSAAQSDSGWIFVCARYDKVANKIFLDGVEIESTAYTTNIGSFANVTVGATIHSDNDYLDADLAEIIVLPEGADEATRELVEGYALWKWGLQANLPSGHPYELAAPTVTPAPVDENFANVSLLLHMDGINGSTSFEDSSLNGYIITVAGAAQISTVSPKFGTGNLVAAPQSAYIQTPADPFNFGTDDLTIEFQFRGTKAAQTGQPYIMATGAYNASVGFYSIASATTGSISWSVSSGVTSRPAGIATTTDCLDGEWHHIAFVRQGNTMMIFADGALEGSVTAAGPFVLNANTRARIGFEWGSPQGAVCQFDELRVTKGVARYTESFTPPDAPFPDTGP
jgi:hypothetical protein